jgi:hypothetical protein
MRQLLIKYGNIVLTTTTDHRVWYHLYLLLIVRVGGYIVNLLDFYSYRLIGKLTSFLHLQEFSQRNLPVASSTSAARLSFSRSKVKLVWLSTRQQPYVFNSNLNLDGAPIVSKSHTNPSHSQTSRLLTSSLSLGVPVPRPTQCVWGA